MALRGEAGVPDAKSSLRSVLMISTELSGTLSYPELQNGGVRESESQGTGVQAGGGATQSCQRHGSLLSSVPEHGRAWEEGGGGVAQELTRPIQSLLGSAVRGKKADPFSGL